MSRITDCYMDCVYEYEPNSKKYKKCCKGCDREYDEWWIEESQRRIERYDRTAQKILHVKREQTGWIAAWGIMTLGLTANVVRTMYLT